MFRFFILCIISLPHFLFSQEWKEYVFSEEMTERYAEDSSASNAYQFAFESTFIEEYTNALAWYDKVFPQRFISNYQDSILQTYDKVPATETLLNRTKDQKIILFSDAIQLPTNRYFLTSILPELWKQGYRNLGLEGLSVDTLKGSQTLKDTMGRYLRESYFHHLVTTALDLGFTLFSYDDNATDYNLKTTNQSQHAINFINNHPNQKTILLCDARHLQEEPRDSTITTIASLLCEAENYPFTVHLTAVVERSSDSLESTVLKAIEQPVYLKTDTSEFRGWSRIPMANMILVMPKWKNYKKVIDNNTPNFTIPHKRFITYPALLMVYTKESSENEGLPFMIKEIHSENDNPTFYLSKGDYTFLFLYEDREVYHRLNVKMTK